MESMDSFLARTWIWHANGIIWDKRNKAARERRRKMKKIKEREEKKIAIREENKWLKKAWIWLTH
jgi:hypothetical protein